MNLNDATGVFDTQLLDAIMETAPDNEYEKQNFPDWAGDVGSNYLQNLFDAFDTPFWDKAQEWAEDHPYTTATATAGVAAAAAFSFDTYLEQSDSTLGISVPVPELKKEFDTSCGTLEVTLSTSLELQFNDGFDDVELLHPFNSDKELKFNLRWVPPGW